MSDGSLQNGDFGALITSTRMKTLGATQVILEPFRKQAISIEWILAIGFYPPGSSEVTAPERPAVLVRLGADKNEDTEIIARIDIGREAAEACERQIYNLDALAQKACRHMRSCAGEVAVFLTQNRLIELFPQIFDHFRVRAICILVSKDPAEALEIWKLQRDLFDMGFVGIGSVQVANGEIRFLLISDCVRCVNGLGAGSRGYVSMGSLGNNGRFANQIFQYLYVKFYALRHCLTAAIPPWEGNHVFGLEDESCTGLHLPELHFLRFTEDDLMLWQMIEPPVNVDLWGYFQEIPACWERHKSLVRRMFQVSAERRRALDDWRDGITLGGKRTLIAVHVRRGDYSNYQSWKLPWFRLIPVDWYITWLKAIWPTVHSPILYVATDEPQTILPLFQEFELTTCCPNMQAIPSHIRDFEIMRRADYLAICNSSFSRMAAILAPSNQKCFCASFQRHTFIPYEPWADRHFWRRFSPWYFRLRRWLLSVMPWLSPAKSAILRLVLEYLTTRDTG